ncbi:MAG: hypothetical protein ABI779_22095 [Acidobacteriota bacterium]
MEPGSAPGTLRFSLTTLYGSDFEGSHDSTSGALADGQPVEVPLYRHQVSLDFTRVELGLQYTLSPQWDLLARIPWEQKAQHAGITFVDPATPDERTAMQRDVDLHHRSVTLRGPGDLMLLGRRRWSGLTLSAGVTVPTGRTIDNPYLAGDRGEQHVHIQFGSGTVDPLLEASYTRPVREHVDAGAYFSTRYPLYENRRTFRAAPDATLGLHTSWRATERVRLRAEGAVFAQGYGEWDGVRDENTGLLATSISAGTTVRWGSTALSVDVRYPLSQRTLTEGDAFTQGPTFVVSVSGALR